MKKTFLIATSLIFFGCATKENTQQIQKPKTCQIENQQAPAWICTGGDVKGYLSAVGSAEVTPLGFSFQRTAALAAARDAISREISLRVKNLFKRYESSIGVKNSEYEKVLENVSKQLSYTTLKNSKILTSWQSKKGTLFILAGVPKENIKDAVIISLQNQKKDANISQKELDKLINEEFGR